MFDQTIHIQAPPGLVWPRMRGLPGDWRVLLDQPDTLFVVAEAELGYVFRLERQTDGSTCLRHLVERESKISELLGTDQDLLAALVGVAEDPAGADLDLDVPAIEERLAHIKRESEEGAQRLRWRPRAAGEEPALASAALPAAKTISPDYISQAISPKSRVTPWFRVWKQALTWPTVTTFEELIDAPGAEVTRAFKWIFMAILAGALCAVLLTWLTMTPVFSRLGFEPPGFGVLLSGSIFPLFLCGPVGGVLGIILFAIWVWFVQVIVKTLGGKVRYNDLAYGLATFQAPFIILICLFVAFLLPFMLVLPHMGTMWDYLSYAPLAGVFLLGTVVVKAVSHFGWVKALLAMLVPCVGALTLLTVLEIKNPYVDSCYEYLAEQYYDRGDEQVKASEFPEAVESFTRAIDLVPDFTEAYCQRGIAYALLRDFDRALADCDEAIVLDSHFGPAYLARGMVYARAYFLRGEVNRHGEREKAIDNLHQALLLDLDPADRRFALDLLHDLEP